MVDQKKKIWVCRTTFLELLFYTFLEYWLQNKWSNECNAMSGNSNREDGLSCRHRREWVKMKLSIQIIPILALCGVCLLWYIIMCGSKKMLNNDFLKQKKLLKKISNNSSDFKIVWPKLKLRFWMLILHYTFFFEIGNNVERIDWHYV